MAVIGLVVYDIGMRMLVPRELFRANGFHDSYIIELCKANGKPLTKTGQVRLVGNSVCPDVAEALVRAALRLRRRPEPIVSPQLRLWQAAA
jgi:DNA (cytosine-5)-methyltransferase 1